MNYIRKDSPKCLALMSIVRRLEGTGASQEKIDQAMDRYYEQSDIDAAEHRRLNRLHLENIRKK